MSEFKIHHDVSELLNLLQVRGGDGAEGYSDLLQKHRTPYVTTTVSAHSAKVKLAEFSKTPEDFLRKYEELKSKNVRNLDPLVYLLSKLSEDKETLKSLQQNAKDRAESSANTTSTTTTSFSLPQTSTKMSMQELDELRKKLGNVTASTNAPMPAEVTRKMLRDRHNKKNPTLPNPVFPNWVYDRTLPLAAQEQALVEDLLFVLSGVDGRDITAQPVLGRQNRSFIVAPTLDMSVKELVNRILPVASYYSTVQGKNSRKKIFIEEKSSFEYGQVNHALTAAMRTLMKEYLILVTQLEHLLRQGLLSLQKLWFYIQPTMRTMEILASIASSVDKGECMGGSTLTLLHDRTFNYTGDSQAQELCLYLTKAASVPYFEILEKWIYRGIIKDPYSEFMVEEHELQKEKIQEDYNDKYWDQRYTIVQHRIPSYLQKMADKILSTGKYLNVVRECGRDVTCPDAKEVLYTLKERAYVEQIEKAFNYASKVLLDFLMEEKELVSRLRLEALLELALRMSTANTDRSRMISSAGHRDEAGEGHFNAEPTDTTLSGLEAFSFDYIVKWPSHSSLTGLLLVCPPTANANFVQNIQYYMMFEVMEPTWHVMERTQTFLDNCLKDCMLTNPELLRIFSKLMSSRFTQSKRMERISLEQGSLDAAASQGVFDNNFSLLLLDLLDKLSIYSTNDCEHSMISIIYRLDFNGFYTERLERMAVERSQKAAS
ncbi:hypothetical protein WMY93_010710 [Mugilogobius chulae]|uniref:Gamma-tubulin complex component n=1 Tax=Mugilogobius chulae TaxID=88201 RepID=A0AAW0PDS9_9GOBI